MAVKLSSYLWLRNDYLVPYSKGEYETGRYLSDEQKQTLREIVDEIDELHSGRESVRGGVFEGPNVFVHLDRVAIEKSSDPRRSGELFTKVHEVLKDRFVDVGVYRQLGRAFGELGLEVHDEALKSVIEYATGEFDRQPYDFKAARTVCAEVIMRRLKEGNPGRER